MARDGEKFAGPRSVTIPDVAREAGVSKSTVSLVLRGSKLIKHETREKVRRVAKRLGYVYNRSAANLRRRSSDLVGMVINDLTNPFFAELAVGMEQALADAGYISVMANTSERLDRQERIVAALREHNAAGLIMCPAIDTPDELLERIGNWRMPLVLVMRPHQGRDLDLVDADYVEGMRQAGDHLARLGHRKIAFIGGRQDSLVFQQRLAGYLKALEGNGLEPNPSLIATCLPTWASGSEEIKRLLRLDEPPTASVCYNDVVAFGVLNGLGERGLTAGRDFAVTGFDDVLAASHTNPPLTTISVNPMGLGETAASILLRRLRDPSAPKIHHVAQPRLVVRRSCGGSLG